MERRAKNRTLRLIKVRLYNIIWKADLYAVRLLLGVLALSLGISNFSLLGSLFVIQGSIMLWSLVCNKRPKSTLWIDAVLGCALWTHTAFSSSVLSNDLSACISIASWWLLVRHYSDEEL